MTVSPLLAPLRTPGVCLPEETRRSETGLRRWRVGIRPPAPGRFSIRAAAQAGRPPANASQNQLYPTSAGTAWGKRIDHRGMLCMHQTGLGQKSSGRLHRTSPAIRRPRDSSICNEPAPVVPRPGQAPIAASRFRLARLLVKADSCPSNAISTSHRASAGRSDAADYWELDAAWFTTGVLKMCRDFTPAIALSELAECDASYQWCSGPVLYIVFTYSLLQAGLGLTMPL
jgi:hypothetical protein